MNNFSGILLLIALVSSAPLQKWYKSEDGSTYYIEPENKYNWFQSWNECARKNMTLMAIDTFSKHQQIDELLRRSFPIQPQFWLAGHDNAIDQRYEWATSGELFSFTNWGPGQPGRTGNIEHCILMWHDFAWHDYPCTNLLGFMCEENVFVKELNKVKKNCENYEIDAHKYKNIMLYVNRIVQ